MSHGLWLVSWQYLRKHLIRSLLTTAGIVLGVAVCVGMHTANQSVLFAFNQTVDKIAGNAADAQMQINRVNVYAMGLLQKDRAPEADLALQKALKLDPKAGQIFEELTELYMATNRFRDAISTAEDTLKKNPDQIDARRALGKEYMRLATQDSKSNEKKAAPEHSTASHRPPGHNVDSFPRAECGQCLSMFGRLGRVVGPFVIGEQRPMAGGVPRVERQGPVQPEEALLVLALLQE